MFFILKTYLVEKSVCFQYNIREIQLIQNINKKTLRHEHILIQVILHEVIQLDMSTICIGVFIDFIQRRSHKRAR